MPEENRVFDIARPGRGQPPATSKPVIVGHHPVTNDPMVREPEKTAPSKIAVYQEEPEPKKDELTPPSTTPAAPDPVMEHHDIPVYTPPADSHPSEAPASTRTAAPALYDSQPEPAGPSDPLVPPPQPEPFERDGTAPLDAKPLEPLPPPGHVEALRPSPHMKRHSPVKWLLILLVAALVAVYVLIGTGTIKTSLDLPPFKHNTPAAAPTKPANTQSSQQPSLPVGFSQYNLTGTDLAFAAPTSWGTPNSTSDPGYSKRGGNNQTDGTHAYIVDFPNNKDVEIAVTAAKYLPAARDTQYYDYLQWCTGTADGKYYFAALDFATAADKTETPTTVVCNQGPLTGVTKLDSSTLLQTSIKNPSGQVIGDLYTKNLSNPDLPVVRIKDAKSTNSVQIKQILATFKVAS
jgi:hypothetical protein